MHVIKTSWSCATLKTRKYGNEPKRTKWRCLREEAQKNEEARQSTNHDNRGEHEAKYSRTKNKKNEPDRRSEARTMRIKQGGKNGGGSRVRAEEQVQKWRTDKTTKVERGSKLDDDETTFKCSINDNTRNTLSQGQSGV